MNMYFFYFERKSIFNRLDNFLVFESFNIKQYY